MLRILLAYLILATQAASAQSGTPGFAGGFLSCTSIAEGPLGVQDSIWVAVLDSLYLQADQPILLVSDSTVPPPRFGMRDTTGLQAFDSLVQTLDRSLVSDFLARNTRPAEVNATALMGLGIGPAIAVVSRTERESAAVDPRTGTYRFARYPGAHLVVGLSRVGLSSDKRRALVHVTFLCGPRCGGTQLVLLARDEKEWRVIRTESGISF